MQVSNIEYRTQFWYGIVSKKLWYRVLTQVWSLLLQTSRHYTKSTLARPRSRIAGKNHDPLKTIRVDVLQTGFSLGNFVFYGQQLNSQIYITIGENGIHIIVSAGGRGASLAFMRGMVAPPRMSSVKRTMMRVVVTMTCLCSLSKSR